MKKKVFPMGETQQSARQRADKMLGRGQGVVNGPDEDFQPQQSGQSTFDPDDCGSANTITSR